MAGLHSPAGASPMMSPPSMHGTEPMWFARLSSLWTCTTYSSLASQRTDPNSQCISSLLDAMSSHISTTFCLLDPHAVSNESPMRSEDSVKFGNFFHPKKDHLQAALLTNTRMSGNSSGSATSSTNFFDVQKDLPQSASSTDGSDHEYALSRNLSLEGLSAPRAAIVSTTISPENAT